MEIAYPVTRDHVPATGPSSNATAAANTTATDAATATIAWAGVGRVRRQSEGNAYAEREHG